MTTSAADAALLINHGTFVFSGDALLSNNTRCVYDIQLCNGAPPCAGTITLVVMKGDERTGNYRQRANNLKQYSKVNNVPKVGPAYLTATGPCCLTASSYCNAAHSMW